MGIGEGGKSLAVMLEERDRLIKETGYFYGLEKMELHDDDPAKMTRFNWRLTNACITARESAKLLSATPTVRTFGECLFMLLLPQGDCVTASHGLAGHVASARDQIAYMAKLGFEDNPKIREGDIFSCNHPRYGGAHAADNYTYVPILYKGELVAWACGINHIAEVGPALYSASVPVLSPTTFTDGFAYPPMKTGENFQIAKWWDLLWTEKTRMATFNILDNNMRVAGAIMVHNAVLGIIEEFGIDYFRRGVREIIERERRRIATLIQRQMVPGIYRRASWRIAPYKGRVGPCFPFADRDFPIHTPYELHVTPDCRLFIDLAGVSREDHHSWNAPSDGCRRLGLAWWWLPQFVHSICVNTAFDYQLDYSIPEGSHLNPIDPQLSSAIGLGGMATCMTPLWSACNQSFFARGVLEEQWSATACGGLLEPSGVFDVGVAWSFGMFGAAGAWSTGGSPYRDGDYAATCGLNPQSDMGEVEEWDLYEPPLVCMARKLSPDHYGHGKFRGGVGTNWVFLVVNKGKSLTISFATGGGIQTGLQLTGTSGGYPGYGDWSAIFLGTNALELIEKGMGYPTTLQEIMQWIREGKLNVDKIVYTPGEVPPIELKDGDIYVLGTHGDAGWGDPIERAPGLIERDLNEGWITPNVAERIYGAIARSIDGKWKVDEEGTTKERQQMRQRRKERAKPFKGWWRQERERVLNKEFREEVSYIYQDILKNGKSGPQFRRFWQVGEDYQL